MSGDLAGLDVVVARATHQAGRLEQLVAARDGRPLVIPLISIVDPAGGAHQLRDALTRIDGYDWLIVTSPNGAERVVAAVDLDRHPAVRVAAVGATSAAVLPHCDLVPSRQSAAGVVAQFPRGPGTVLLVQATGGAPTLEEGLRGLGWSVDRVDAYTTVPRTPTPSERAIAASADALLLTSGSTARGWTAAFGPAPEHVMVVSIGPETTAAAEKAGLRVDATSADHSLDGLLDTLARTAGRTKRS